NKSNDKSTEAPVPDFEFNLNDISHVPDDEIKGTILLRVLCLTLKYIFSPDLKHKLLGIFKLMREFEDKTRGTEYIEILLRYLTRSAKKITKEELEKAVSHLVEGGDVMATIAEQWLEEGREEGK
ncbi:MAG: Rpn family recombination-promoting nuclease/putative transposase, partial [bacterium]|nr:Rpn family recombination-promoting nuclease/putative transposase [bacterium]